MTDKQNIPHDNTTQYKCSEECCEDVEINWSGTKSMVNEDGVRIIGTPCEPDDKDCKKYHDRECLLVIAHNDTGSVSIAGDNYDYDLRIIDGTGGYEYPIEPYQFNADDITNIGILKSCCNSRLIRIYIVLKESWIITAEIPYCDRTMLKFVVH